MTSSSSNTPSAPSAPRPIIYEAVPNKIVVTMNGILLSTYSIVVTVKLNSFLVLRGRFDSKQFDIVVYDARTILELLERFNTCLLANQHIHVWGEYSTTAYCKDRTGYPSHSIKLQNLQDAHGHTYTAYTARDLAPMYDLFLTHKLYTCWQDQAMRTTKASHKDFYQKYKKLYIDFCRYHLCFPKLFDFNSFLVKSKGEDVDPPPIVDLTDILQTRTSRKRQLYEMDPTTFDSIFEVNRVSDVDAAASSPSKSLLLSGGYRRQKQDEKKIASLFQQSFFLIVQ